ncbi:MAG: hypothetical protein H6622_05755 [Halobacteriovoraceae bacterium]|nr:hypothetical protein [Halobacteriovoraceae bacterium]
MRILFILLNLLSLNQLLAENYTCEHMLNAQLNKQKLIGATGGPYKTSPVVVDFKDYEDFGEWERREFEVFVDPNGLLVDRRGRTLNTIRHEELLVMDESGRIFRAQKEFGYSHHPSFNAGRPLAMSGGSTIQQGFLREIDNGSGHYKQGEEFLDQLLIELDRRRAILVNVDKFIITIQNNKIIEEIKINYDP